MRSDPARPQGERTAFEVPRHVLVVGYSTTGQAVADVLRRRGSDVTAIDDHPSEKVIEFAAERGIELVASPDEATLRALVGARELIVVSPGVPPKHPVFYLAEPDKLVSEIELAYRLSRIPIVAITGTNGKTSVTSLVSEMLVASGVRARAVGNIGTPLIAVVDELLEVAVVEVSSFQLAFTSQFDPFIGTWLNFAEDHLDWHRDLADYENAKARIWSSQNEDDIAVANLDDPVVLARANGGRAKVVTFGESHGDYHLEGERFVGPHGTIAELGVMPRGLPHDRMNALGALATALEAGATVAGCEKGLSNWQIPPHRVEQVATIAGVSYFDDSKATTPSAVIAALASFQRVVLIAGGRNKGLDLSSIAAFVMAAGPQVRAVVAIGESQFEITSAFNSVAPVERAASMDEAVAIAASIAVRGDTVLLSPGAASFDWYSSYEERGEDFKRAVLALSEKVTS